MNKQLKRLADEAGFFPTELTQVGPSIEKFAGLIVMECAGWVNDNVGLIDEKAKADLLKHFGVK